MRASRNFDLPVVRYLLSILLIAAVANCSF